MADYSFKSEFNDKWSATVRKMTRLLSGNSRISITEMAERLDVSRKTVEDKLARAEKEFGIRYTIELDEAKLGLITPHLILATFTEKPDYDDIAKILKGSPTPQVAVPLEGSHSMFIYANAESQDEYVHWDKTTQVMLSKYKVAWRPSDLAFRHLGFFPIRNELLHRLSIPKAYKEMLLLLNQNSRMPFSEMAKRLGLKQGTLAYKFKKLLKMGYIKRFTIVMRTPPGVSMVSLFGKYIIAQGFEDDSMAMREEITFIDDQTPLISRCLFSAQLIGTYDFFFVGAYDSYDVGYNRLIKYYKSRFRRHGVKAVYGAIGGALVGDFPVRNLDVHDEFNMIRWIPGSAARSEKHVRAQK